MNSYASALVELYKRGSFKSVIGVDGVTNPKQLLAFQMLNDRSTWSIGYGGAAGGAKSWTGCTWLLFSCLTYPGVKYFIGREELKRLRDSTLLTFFKVCKNYGIQRDVDWKYNGQDHYIEFANGSRIDLLDLKFIPSDPYYERYGSSEYTAGWLEEAGEVHFGAYDTLKSRIGRHLNDKYHLSKKILTTLNPKKNWTYNEYWKPYREHKEKEGIRFIQALVDDNPFIESGYKENLLSISDKVKKQRLLYGNFDYDDDDNSLISFNKINDLFTNSFVPDEGQTFLSSDLAITNDSFVIVAWKGFRIKEIICMNNVSRTEITNEGGMVNSSIDFTPLISEFERMAAKHKVSRSNMIYDADGIGHHMKKYLAGAIALHSGQRSIEPEYNNLKANLYYRLADFVNTDKIFIDCNVANIRDRMIDEFQSIKRSSDAGEKLQLVPKSEVKELIGHSPDITDAIAYRMLFWITRRT